MVGYAMGFANKTKLSYTWVTLAHQQLAACSSPNESGLMGNTEIHPAEPKVHETKKVMIDIV